MQEKYENIACNLCGNDDTKKLAERGQFNLPTNVVICRNCGLTYLNPRWTKPTYFEFYTNKYDKYYRPNIKNKSVTTNKTIPIFERLSKKGLLDKQPENILDVGSGSGLTLDFFKTKYPKSNLYAIEPSDTAVAMLEKKGIENISRDVDNDWHLAVQNKFDLIIMRHVLEHFSDPIAALKKIESTLTDDGTLYIAVPNCSNPTTPLLTHWFRVVHTYYFNKTTLHGVLNKSQLKLIKAVEGDEFNSGEMYAFAKRAQKDSDSLILDNGNFEQQLEVYESRLKKEHQVYDSFRRQLKFFNQRIRRAFT